MKQITAVIQPHMLAKVEHALHELPQSPGFTLLRVTGHGRRTPAQARRPAGWDLEEHNHVALIVVCSDERAPQVVEAIRQSAHTGLSGDGIIVVCEALEVVHIGTGERGDAAL